MRAYFIVFAGLMLTGCGFGINPDKAVDSAEAQQIFSALFTQSGVATPSPTTVSNLHAWSYGFSDHHYLIKFECSTQAPVDSLISRFQMTQVSQPQHYKDSWSPEAPRPPWWTPPTNAIMYSGAFRNRFVTMWVEGMQTVYLQDWSY